MRTAILLALGSGLMFVTSNQTFNAQTEVPPVGTLFLQARSGCTVTISKAGTELGSFTVSPGTLLSARDERQTETHVGNGRFELHGDVELRLLPPSGKPTPTGVPAHVLMADAPMVFKAHGIDVVIDNAGTRTETRRD